MIDRCNAVGVRIYVDAVINHMCGALTGAGTVTRKQSFLSLYSLNCAKSCNEFAGPIPASLRPGNKAPFEDILQRWRVVGNIVSNLTGARFEPQASRTRNENVAA